jgi:hypothetical protein
VHERVAGDGDVCDKLGRCVHAVHLPGQNGTYTVKARIIDDGDGFTEYTTVVTVNNVAPTATLVERRPGERGEPGHDHGQQSAGSVER